MDINNPTIIAAGIAAVTSIGSIIFSAFSLKATKKGNKEITYLVQKAEDKRTEAQIDASITWNARVEWIQNVRRVTSEFIAGCYTFIRYDKSDHNLIISNLNVVHEKKLLLILYFGPDDSKININKAKNILDETTNKSKNKMIVDLIDDVYDNLGKYFIDKSNSIEKLKPLLENIELLTKAIQIYLKIEWNNTKNRKIV